MLSELPKLFGKAFAIGFFLPAALVALALQGVASAFNLTALSTSLLKADLAVGATIIGLALWVFAIVLLAFNRPIIRLLEGYGAGNPALLLADYAQAPYRRAQAEIDRLSRLSKAEREQAPNRQRLVEQALLLAENYPHQDDLLLPTKFGNVVRAFEAYPRVLYGLEATRAWPRLVAILPADYRALIDDAKAQTDFWANLWLGALLVAAVYLSLAIGSGSLPHWWIPLAGLLAAPAAAWGARIAAGQWGEYVKSAFDLYRGELCTRLGYKLPAGIEAERAFWQALSKAVIFRSALDLDQVDAQRATDARKKA